MDCTSIGLGQPCLSCCSSSCPDPWTQHMMESMMSVVWWQTPSLCVWLKDRAFPSCSCSSEGARYTSEERGNPTSPSHHSGDSCNPLGSSQPSMDLEG